MLGFSANSSARAPTGASPPSLLVSLSVSLFLSGMESAGRGDFFWRGKKKKSLVLTKLCPISLAATHNHPLAFLPLGCNAVYTGYNGSKCPPNIWIFFPVMTLSMGEGWQRTGRGMLMCRKQNGSAEVRLPSVLFHSREVTGACG